MKHQFVVSAFALASALAIGCGDDATPANNDAGTGGGTDAGTGGGTDAGQTDKRVNVDLTLVPITAADTTNPIADPHEVEVLDSDTGLALDPVSKATTAAVSGKVTLSVPDSKLFNVYVHGVARTPEATSTYDTIVLNSNSKNGETLLRISSQGTAGLAAMTSGFTANSERAAVAATVYYSPGGKRKGAVGCAKVYIDGNDAAMYDLRYSAVNKLPTTLDKQDKTLRTGGFYIANLSKGKHSIKVSLDDGATFIGDEVKITIGPVRSEATSPFKAVIYQLGIDIDGAANPTLAACPADPTT